MKVPVTFALVAAVVVLPALSLSMMQAEDAGDAPAPSTAESAAWYARALAADHNHMDRQAHLGASTPNFEVLGWDPLPTWSAGGANLAENLCGEIAQRADGRRLAVINAWWYDAVDLHVLDVTDPLAPEKIGEFSFTGTATYDSAITRDGRYAVVSLSGVVVKRPNPNELLANVGADALFATYTDQCGRSVRLDYPQSFVEGSGILLIDLADPAQPRLVDFAPMAGVNIHSVSSAEVDGHQYIVGSVVNFAHSASYFGFYEVSESALGAKLVPLSVFAPPSAGAPDLKPQLYLLNGHTDAAIARHEPTGKTLAYLSAWDGGMIILDFSIPQAPIMLSEWTPNADLVGSSLTDLGVLTLGCFAGSVHGVDPMKELIEGRHYLMVGQECPFKRAGDVGGSVFIVDDTDPTAPKLRAEWHLPADTGEWTVEYQASPHYTTLVGDTMLVSMYHAGLWAVDLGAIDLGSAQVQHPPAIGVYVPDRLPPVYVHTDDGLPWPLVLDVNAFEDGTIVMYDARNGVYTLSFDAASPMDAAFPFGV